MELLENDDELFEVEGLVFEKIDSFKYFRSTFKCSNK